MNLSLCRAKNPKSLFIPKYILVVVDIIQGVTMMMLPEVLLPLYCKHGQFSQPMIFGNKIMAAANIACEVATTCTAPSIAAECLPLTAGGHGRGGDGFRRLLWDCAGGARACAGKDDNVPQGQPAFVQCS